MSIMYKKVVIGDDGLDGGHDAIALALVLTPEAEFVLAATYPYDSTFSRFVQLGYGDALRDGVTEALHQTRDACGLGDSRTVAIPDTSPARGLHRCAEQEHADLLVVGSAHHGPAGRILLGDVARAVLHGAPCPVAIAPRDFSGGALETIGVAFDGGPEAYAALATATGLAGSCGARLVVRQVIDYDRLPTLAGYAQADVAGVAAEIRAETETALAIAVAGLGVEVDARAVSGVLAVELDALTAQVDLMVCGSRGWGAAHRLTLGSTSDRLIHHAPCPVLVVPHTAVASESERRDRAVPATS
ncbi:universal stress protein [Conexibacter woesei]|uniref:universal stress protein n=1 Tax=Conexibacter woesei TaxID=191495 RepID=UPI00068891A5|nr:universal stress protein [Conexibacter woesei]